MSHDVFISYSEPDKAKADAVCSILERNGVRCWVAPRDIVPGMTWGSSIVRAIQQSKVFILVFSSHSNHSPQVVREVERAVRQSIPIIPFRIERATPTGDMEYFISAQHWLDALDPPLERHMERLASVVKKLLAEDLRPEAGAAVAEAKAAEAKSVYEAKAAREAKTARETAAAGGEPAPSPAARAATAPPPGLPPRVERAATPPRSAGPLAPLSHSPAKPIAIAGGIVGAVLLLGLFVILVIALTRNGEEEILEPPVSTPPASEPPATTTADAPTTTTDAAENFTLNPGLDRVHFITVPQGQTRTLRVYSDDFDAVLEVWQELNRIDNSTTPAELVLLSIPGEWVVVVESYNRRGGEYSLRVTDGESDEVLSENRYTLGEGNRAPHVIEIPPGGTRLVTASSSAFDVVLKVLVEKMRRDAALSGNAEEVVLSEPGNWELIVSSYTDGGSGDYTLTVQ